MCQPGGLTTLRPLLKWPLQQSRGAARDITPRSFPYAPGRPQAGHTGIPAAPGAARPPAREHRPPCLNGGVPLCPFPFQPALRICPPKSQWEQGTASLPLVFGCDTTASPDKERGAQHQHIPASLHIPRLPASPANPHTRPCSHVSEIH